MPDVQKYVEEKYNDFSCLSAQELLDHVDIDAAALTGEVAMQVCCDQIVAAIEQDDIEGAIPYIAIRPVLARSAFRLAR